MRCLGWLVLVLGACTERTSESDSTDSELTEFDTATDTATKGIPEEHCGTISAPETWGAGPHLVTCDVYIEGATVTVSPGATVRVAGNRGLYVGYFGERGNIDAQGTAEQPIVFRADAGAGRGAWSGLWFSEPAGTAKLVHTSIEDAGGSFTYAALTVTGGTVLAQHLDLRRVDGGGFRFEHLASFDPASVDILVEDAERAGTIEAAAAASVPEEGASFGGADSAYVFVNGGSLTEDATWGDVGVPYFVENDLYVESAAAPVLSLDPGVHLRFATGRGLYVAYFGNEGAIAANGTAEKPIVFDGVAGAAGEWAGVWLADSTIDAETVLAHTTIANAGGAFLTGALRVEAAEPLVDHLTILGSQEYGFDFGYASAFAAGSSELQVSGCDVAGRITPEGAGTLPPTSALTGNTHDEIHLDRDSTFDESATWQSLGVPWVVKTNLYVESNVDIAVLTIEAGATVAFSPGHALYVSYFGGFGGLQALGTASAPITFTSVDKQPGDWAGISFWHAAVDDQCVLQHVSIGYAGSSTLANLKTSDASPTISDAYLHDSSAWGLWVYSGDPSVTNVTYANNALGDAHP